MLVCAGTGDFYQDANIRYTPDIQVTRDGRFGDRPIKAHYTNFAPRLGVAWSPTSNWSVRAGMGRFFVQDIGNIVFDKNRNINGRLTVQSTATNLISTWKDPFNFGGSTLQHSARHRCVQRPLVLTDQIDRKTPHVDQHEAIVERQLSDNMAVEVSYLATEGHDLQRWINLANQPAPGTSTPAERSPFPEFGLFQGAANVGYSHYDSLGVKLTRRYSAGLTVLGPTRFRSRQITAAAFERWGTDPLNPQNSYCLSCEDGPSVFDQRHRFVTSVVYDLPFGPDRRYLNQGGVVGGVVGGWKVTSVVTLASISR